MAANYRELQANARKSALSEISAKRVQRQERERRLEDLAIKASAALTERRHLVAETERRAGDALAQMTDTEGLALRDAVEWIGGDLTFSEAKRLRRVAAEDTKVRANNQAAERADAVASPVTRA